MEKAFSIGSCVDDECIDELIRELEGMRGRVEKKPICYSIWYDTLENRESNTRAFTAHLDARNWMEEVRDKLVDRIMEEELKPLFEKIWFKQMWWAYGIREQKRPNLTPAQISYITNDKKIKYQVEFDGDEYTISW